MAKIIGKDQCHGPSVESLWLPLYYMDCLLDKTPNEVRPFCTLRESLKTQVLILSLFEIVEKHLEKESGCGYDWCTFYISMDKEHSNLLNSQ
jgi:hypothetical protein